jgi:hypothetical protein
VIIAKQSTARTVTVGPVLDADGVAVTDGVVADFKIAKNGGAPAALNGSATLTHRNTGHYSLALTASDLDTVGQAEVVIDDTVNACPVKEITVVEEAVYDALFGASALGYVANAPVSVAQWAGTNVATPTVAGVPEVDMTHVAGEAVTAGADDILYSGTAQAGASTTITLDTGASATDDLYNGLTVSLNGGTGAGQGNRRITDYNGTTKVATVYPAWAVNPSSDTEFTLSSGGGFVAADTAAAVWNAVRATYATSGTFGQGAASVQGNVTGSVQSLAADAINILTFSSGTVASIAGTVADSVLDEAMSGHTTAGTLGKYVADVLAQTDPDAIADAVLDRADGVEAGHTVREYLARTAAVLVGKLSGAGTGTEVFRNMADTADAVTASVDGSGNRTAVTYA